MKTILLNSVLYARSVFTQEEISLDCIQRVAAFTDNSTALKTAEGHLIAIVALPFEQVRSELSLMRNSYKSDIMDMDAAKDPDWAKRCLANDWRDVTIKSEEEFKAATKPTPKISTGLPFPSAK